MSKDSANIFALSAVPQADYNTALAGSTSPKKHRQVEKTDRVFAKYSAPASDNRGYSTGTPYPTRRTLESHDVTHQFTEDLSSQLLGERAYAAMGVVDSVETVTGEVWTHTFEMLNPQDAAQLPAYGYAEKAAESASRPNAHDVRYDSFVMAQWSVQGQGRSILQSVSQWQGSGKRVSPSAIQFFDTGSQVILLEDMVQNYFRNTQAALKLYPQKDLGGTVFNVNCDFRDFEFSINNNLLLDAGYLGCAKYQNQSDPESGAVRGKCEIGDPTVQFNFTMIMNDAYDAYDKMKTMQSISAQLDYVGSVISGSDTHKASFILNHANIVDIDHSPVDGENALRITTEPLALGQIMPVSLVVVNDVASYTVPSW